MVGQASACQSERSSDSSLSSQVSVSPRLRVKIPVPLLLALAILCALASAQPASIINAVRGLIAQHDLADAERLARSWQARNPPSPELAAALSWLARGNLEAKNLDQADAFAKRQNAGLAWVDRVNARHQLCPSCSANFALLHKPYPRAVQNPYRAVWRMPDVC